MTKIVLSEDSPEGAVRADIAWALFFGRSHFEGGAGMPRFAEWLWDELGELAGSLNLDAKGEVVIAIPHLEPNALDFLLRLVSFWGDEVRVARGGSTSGDLWKRPVVNVLDDGVLDGVETAQKHDMDNAGSVERNLMPTLGPGRAFFSVQVVAKGSSTARLHSHSALDEYYLILDGSGTLRFNGKTVDVKRGDLIGKPAGPDAATHFIADKGEALRVLDMEVWHQRAHFSKDVVSYPDFREVIMRGRGWNAVVPMDSLMPPKDAGDHYDEGYKRSKDGSWAPSSVPGQRKTREE